MYHTGRSFVLCSLAIGVCWRGAREGHVCVYGEVLKSKKFKDFFFFFQIADVFYQCYFCTLIN